MLTKPKLFCPECGSGRIEKELIDGHDMGDKVCLECRKSFAPEDLITDPSFQTCKACKTFFPASKAYLFSGKGKDFKADLKKGQITCPNCKAIHRAANLRVTQGSSFQQIHHAFGELLKK